MNILMIEAEDDVLQEVITYLSDKAKCQVLDLPLVAQSPDVLKFPNLEIRIREQTAHYNSTLIPLSHHEFFTLLFLAQHPNWVFSKEQIYEAVWKESGDGGAAVVNVVSQIRKKIGDRYIKTVINSGYKFEV